MEVWKPIPGTDDLYDVSDQGRIRSWVNGRYGRRKTPMVLSPGTGSGGYKTVQLRIDAGKYRAKRLHVLVLETFTGPCPPGQLCRHLNGDPSDNRLANLSWGTYAENTRDMQGHGTANYLRGTDMHFAKLTDEDVRWARSVLIKGDKEFGYAALGRCLGVSHETIRQAINGKTWKHVEKDTD